MSTHFIRLCLKCKAVIEQCRCPSKDKSQLWGTCLKCAGMCGGDNS